MLVTGVRQAGKSTLLEHFLEEGRRKVTLDDLEDRALAREDPEFFLQSHRPPVFIDEVQYAPELFPYLKIYADRNPDEMGAVWLTGSQPFALMELAGESLAGRVGILHLLPLSQGEAHGDGVPIPREFNLDAQEERAEHRKPATVQELDERIWRGSMPTVVSGRHTDPARFYRDYQQTYIERDVREIDGAASLVDFSRFMRAAAARVGQLLNVESLARDVDIPRRKAQEWLGILERSDVVFLLQPYSNNALSRAVKTPKLYFTDTGMAAWLGRWTSPDSMAAGAEGGDLFENYVVSEIRKSLNNSGENVELWFYRDRDAKEIDLAIERDGVLTPIEVKRGASPRRSATSAFGLLDRSGLERGTGAVVCMKEHAGYASRDCLYVPTWML
ncbi:MAG: ATP-binding protein [Coriobacteriales bacterium]|nr:ATP-binding protein [Coriobacteriales bacterium]